MFPSPKPLRRFCFSTMYKVGPVWPIKSVIIPISQKSVNLEQDYKGAYMNRVMVIRRPNGDESVLAEFTLKPGGTWGIVEAKFPHRSYPEIFHPSFNEEQLVLQSSTSVELSMVFIPSWCIKKDESRLRVVHGEDLLDLVLKTIQDSGLR